MLKLSMRQQKLTTMQDKMISNAYEKADFQIIEFAIEDVLTASKVVHTTEATTSAPTTTLPGTTAPTGGNIGGGSGDAVFDFSDIFP